MGPLLQTIIDVRVIRKLFKESFGFCQSSICELILYLFLMHYKLWMFYQLTLLSIDGNIDVLQIVVVGNVNAHYSLMLMSRKWFLTCSISYSEHVYIFHGKTCIQFIFIVCTAFKRTILEYKTRRIYLFSLYSFIGVSFHLKYILKLK